MSGIVWRELLFIHHPPSCTFITRIRLLSQTEVNASLVDSDIDIKQILKSLRHKSCDKKICISSLAHNIFGKAPDLFNAVYPDN